MKLHRILAEGCVAVLEAVLGQGLVLDRVLETTFAANPRWGKRDRAFVAETVFEIVRWRRALAFVADSEAFTALCAAQWRRMEIEIPGWWAWTGSGLEEMSSREGDLPNQPRAVRESIPDWLDARGELEIGPRWNAEISALNRRAPVVLRVNRLLGSVAQAAGWLASEGIETITVPQAPDALQVIRGRIGKPLLATGRVEIQDAGSQRIAPMLNLAPGMRVIDACAGAGGKTLHAAALMRNQGEILALDVTPRKLGELERRAARAGATIIRTAVWDEATLSDLAGWADCVLIDAPCSGLGTLRRQPDLKWRLTESSLEKSCSLQAKVLRQYAALAKPGGSFVYATCSILPSENEDQIDAVLAENPSYGLQEMLTVSPATDGSDGLFGARLECRASA